ncbi:MAG TPA: GGDEF domain-containing protein [Candidatus Rubrimentiphilum sp.]|nr:GGDEF domain-containing protein [Candidatus Rubrimentiphilum sp.]
MITAASLESAQTLLSVLAAALSSLEPAVDAMLVFRPDAEELRCVFSAGGRAEYYGGLRLRIDGDTLPAQAARRGHRVALVPGADAVIPTDRAGLAVPMYAGRSLLAIVYASARRAVADADLLARTIAHAAVPYALAIEREADRASATYDGLTGLHTARAFRSVLQEDLRGAACASHTSLALWFVDTDGFKGINDTYGHAAGDAILQRLAELLRDHLIPGVDVGARNGGDEFCAILRNAHKTDAIARAQQFCDAVRGCDFGVALPITASIGVAAYPYDAVSANELLEIADAAMYHSKRSGRDRVAFPDGRGSFAVHR